MRVRVRWKYFRRSEFNNKWDNISPTTSSTTHPRLQIVIDSLRGDGIDPEELLARSCLVKIFKIYLSTLVWGWYDSSSALTTLARFSQRWQLKQGRISFFIFILFFIRMESSSSSLTWDWSSRFKFQQGGDKVGGEKVCQEQVSSPILAFSLLNWLKNSSFNLVVISSWNKLFSRLTAAHFQKKLSDPNFHLIALPPCIRFAVCCHLRGFMAEHWQCLPTLPHMPCYYHQPALRIYSSTSSPLFFSLSIHEHILNPWMGWWEWFPCS